MSVLLSDMYKSNYSNEVNRILLLQNSEFHTRPFKPVGSHCKLMNNLSVPRSLELSSGLRENGIYVDTHV